MIYFTALSAIIALIGLVAAAAAQETSLFLFGLALFAFGVLFALLQVEHHFDAQDAARH